MNNSHVFISHSSRDDAFVKELRQALEGLGVTAWVDSRELSGGSKLAPEIDEAIEQARQFVAVISPHTVNSPWVRKEIHKALEVKRRRGDEGYRVVPLLLPGIEPSALALWFNEEQINVRVSVGAAGGLAEALPAILAALGERVPDDWRPVADVAPAPVAELVLRLQHLKMETSDGRRRARAVAQLVYEPPDKMARHVESRTYAFTAPLGPIESEELRWYLEDYYVWPVGIFQERARRVEEHLPEWGRVLYYAALGTNAADETLAAWQQDGAEVERRFSVYVDADLSEGASEEARANANESAAELLALPWELLHNGYHFLFHGRHPVRVRRRLPNRRQWPSRPTRLPIRILLVSPRPDDLDTSFIDHRVSARPLVEAVEGLGELARLTVLTPPTFPALEETLHKAEEAGTPYDVVHLDGHGFYDRQVGLGGFFFEDPKDAGKLSGRGIELVHADRLAEMMRGYHIPLVFLEVGQSAKTESDPTASVAARLLEEGVSSVVAMSHAVLVETARRFVGAFYGELARGRRVGSAMLAGQRELESDTIRGKMLGAGVLHLQDWFVPVLYQDVQDPQLVSKLPPEDVRRLEGVKRRLSLGDLPEPTKHEFVGRSRELLALERLLHAEPWAVVRGQGGEGKTTLATELARWLVRTGRHDRAAFVSLEHYADTRGVLDSLGRQLLPEGEGYSVANYPDLEQALQPVERALRSNTTIVVLDNVENALPDGEGGLPAGAESTEKLFALCRKLLDASPATRLVFTTREPLPAPFDDGRREIALGALSREDAVRLVSEVMKREGSEPKGDDPGAEPQEIVELVEGVGRHARALVLLSREVARQGVRATTENLRRLMERLHEKFPGDRENSLYASVELSLRRLPPESRERVKALAAFHGGAHIVVLSQMLGAKPEETVELARQLTGVGLAENMGDNHLRLDPALPPYLLSGMSKAEREDARARWAEAMQGLTTFLYQQRAQDTGLAARLTLLELPNLLALLRWAETEATPEEAVKLADSVEHLLSGLGRSQALVEAGAVRERAARKLGGWGHARFMAASAEVDRLLERGEVREAHASTARLLERCLEAGEGAYLGAAYDLAMAHCTLGKVLEMGGAAAAALPLLGEARRRFEALALDGNTSAARMASVALTESGDCLGALGRLDEAAAAYEEAVRSAEELGDQRSVAVGKGQLGYVRLRQARYAEALAAYEEARQTFDSLGEPRSVAIAWHQIGVAHRQAGQHEQAERAYRQSLATSVQQQNAAGEASSLGELGNLYHVMGRPEEAVRCFRQAADIYVRLQDQRREGTARNNLAATLLKIGRHDEARTEVLRAVECKEPFGHVTEPWTSWHILHQLETATGDAEAAARARQRAVESYLSYRREGGHTTTPSARICAAATAAIEDGDTSELEAYLSQPLGEDVPPWVRVVFPKLLAVLRGERDPALAVDPELDFDDAVELLLLLEALLEAPEGQASKTQLKVKEQLKV